MLGSLVKKNLVRAGFFFLGVLTLATIHSLNKVSDWNQHSPVQKMSYRLDDLVGDIVGAAGFTLLAFIVFCGIEFFWQRFIQAIRKSIVSESVSEEKRRVA